MNYPLLLSCISTFIAVCAFILGFLNYWMSRKLPNENKIFEEKIKAYQVLIKVLNETAATFIECSNEFEDIRSEGGNIKSAKEELNGQLDESYYKLEDTIYEQSLVVPDSILEKIYDYFDLLDHEEFLEEMATGGKVEEFEEKTNDYFDAIVNEMRRDLSFDKLNVGLKKRIGGK
ncbi:hypothetical protein [Mucilaginibacter sp. SJ]|uniref:hypothetical protein n=1 Tax=Mucilaginibacter sp. SJ TaxID=3029053 RepID=UPI0023A94FF2|nr:hypothetical protein [Mucilaginibacter sp. SJ]WEA01814.1 hypothetical protein MusilaSJ_02610 [Mucilaginibacter sp. SJ]